MLNKHKAVILAGGLGTRLYPFTRGIPKPLFPINGKPIINYLVDLFRSQGVKEVAVLINEKFKEDFYWWKKRYYPECEIKFFEEKEPLGTFGGLYYLKDWIGDSSFFVTNGDELKEVNLSSMVQFHEEKKRPATLALLKVPNPQNYGVVVCNFEEGTAKAFIEKPKDPPSEYINTGLYLFSPKIFNYHEGPKFIMIEKDIFPKLAERGELSAFAFKGKWMDCGTPERYQDAWDKWK